MDFTLSELQMIAVINTARMARSIGSLRPVKALGTAARRHSRDMAKHPDLEHIGSDGSDGGQRIREAGYNPERWREAVGWGFGGDIDRMVNWWLNSPDHVGILLDPNMKDIGVGYAAGGQWGHYWTVDFGTTNDPIEEPPVVPQPGPYTSHVPVVTAPARFATDLLKYLRGDGRSYRVTNAEGGNEIFQTQVEGDRFYQVKAWENLSRVNWEEFMVSGEFIGRGIDTSPEMDRYYSQYGAPWVRRYMRAGESFSHSKRVQFFNFSDCAKSDYKSGNPTDTITFVTRHESYRFRTGIALPDVVELKWEQGGERYFYAAGYGLVGWERAHQDPNTPSWSAIAEMRPDVPVLERLRIRCL